MCTTATREGVITMVTSINEASSNQKVYKEYADLFLSAIGDALNIAGDILYDESKKCLILSFFFTLIFKPVGFSLKDSVKVPLFCMAMANSPLLEEAVELIILDLN